MQHAPIFLQAIFGWHETAMLACMAVLVGLVTGLSRAHSLGDLIHNVVDMRAALDGADGVDKADLHHAVPRLTQMYMSCPAVMLSVQTCKLHVWLSCVTCSSQSCLRHSRV